MVSKLVVPVALGLSLVTVTALVVYYVFKKDEDEEGKTVKTARVNIIEVTVPKSIVPALIGRSGSNIKDIEKKSGAMIHFKKFSDKDYDVCIIRGRSQATQIAETLVHDFIKQQPDIVEDNMTVPGWACGRIIGSGGESINDISHRSGARVKIEGGPTRDNNVMRTISFKGTKEQIVQAKKLIEGCVSQEKCRREIEQSKRSPRHAPPPHSPASSDHSDDIAGDRAKCTHYKRPAERSGASISVYVSAVSSPSRFWVQLAGPQVAQLDDLVADMTEYYSRQANRDMHKLSQVSVGQMVAAVFRHDGRWYRARVHDIRPNEFDATQQVADVFFVDYGDSEYVAVHELCELRADLLRLRFQAMECFLAGVCPAGAEADTVGVSADGHTWERWHPTAVERFEELTQVARWKALVSRTCSYRKPGGGDGRDKEIPGIKLYDVDEEGELDIGAALIAEGWAVAAPPSPRASPPPPTPQPFGDLGSSRVLSMVSGDGDGATVASNARASSVPKDHRDEHTHTDQRFPTHADKENERMMSSQSVASGLQNTEHKSEKPSIANFDISYPNGNPSTPTHVNGSNDFLTLERQNEDRASIDTITPHTFKMNEDLKANMNRIDSHHNLEAMARSNTELHK